MNAHGNIFTVIIIHFLAFFHLLQPPLEYFEVKKNGRGNTRSQSYKRNFILLNN